MPIVHNEHLSFIHIPKTAGYSITEWMIKNIPNSEINGMHMSTKPINSETFTVVRNPWDRVVSLWAFWNEIQDKFVSFEEFVQNIKDCRFIESENVCITLDTPQKTWIPNGVTYLLRFETLEDDFKIIQEKFGCSEPLPHINASKHKEYKTYYTPETWNIVAEVFKDDIEAFGYT